MVKRLPAMVSMELDDNEREEMANPSPPRYPWGLCISLCEDELEKLGLEDEEIQVGDMIHLVCMAKVTSYSESDNELSGPHCRVELQITHIAAEDEDDEEEEKPRTSKLYR